MNYTEYCDDTIYCAKCGFASDDEDEEEFISHVLAEHWQEARECGAVQKTSENHYDVDSIAILNAFVC